MPYARNREESDCGCAGCFSALHAIALYAEVFEGTGALDNLEAVASFYGPNFYQLPRNTKQITLSKTTWRVPDEVPFAESGLVTLGVGSEMTRQME